MFGERREGRLADYDRVVGNRMVESLRAQARPYEKAVAKSDLEIRLNFRDWIDSELVELIARNPDVAPARLAASELRRREGWRTPAKWSLIVSVLALAVALIALSRTY